MKKVLVLVLLISLGLNVGLGVRLWKGTCGLPGRSSGLDHPGFSDHPRGGSRGGADGSGGGRDGKFWQSVMERRLAFVTDQLGLDDEQTEAFKSTHQQAAVEFLAQRVKVQEARRQLMTAASAPDFGVEALRHLIADVGRQQVKLDSMVTETMLQEMEILDEDQRRQYMRILPINRFGGRGTGPGAGAERGTGRRRP